MMLKRNTIWLLFLSAFFVAGCERDLPIPGIDGETTFTLNLARMDAAVANTYAMSATDEYHINTLDILLFNESGSHNFYQRIEIDNAKIKDNGIPTAKSVKVEISAAAGNYQVVLLANLRHEIDSLEGLSVFTSSATKEDVLKRVTFNNKEWKTGASPRYLPMWGEAAGVYSFPHPVNSSIKVDMLRSIARIDVGINYNDDLVAQGLGDLLKIKKVSLANTYYKGTAVPAAANYSNLKVLAATLPFTPPALVTGGADYEIAAPAFAFEREIYTTEHPNASTNPTEAFKVFVGGYYNNSTQLSWYRIDLTDTDFSSGYLPILRNHRYIVNIKEVNGPGYATIEEADNNHTYIDAQVLLWNDEGVDVNIGQYNLDVDRPKLELYKEAGSVTLNIVTDYPGAGNMSGEGFNFKPGIFIRDIYSPGGWLTINDLDANKGDGAMTRNLVLSWDGTTVAREAQFYICAGNMSYKFVVSQSTDSWLVATPATYYTTGGGLKQLTIAPTVVHWMAEVHSVSVSDNLISISYPNTNSSPLSDGNIYFTTTIDGGMIDKDAWVVFRDIDGIYPEAKIIPLRIKTVG